MEIRLQVAFDHVSSEVAAQLAQRMGDAVDMAEAGTPMLAREGANWVTVLGCAEDVVIGEVVDVAQAHDGQVCVDLIGVRDPLARAREVMALGTHAVAVHASAANSAGPPRVIDYALMRALRAEGIPFVAAGGVNATNITSVAELRPAIVVVGSAVLNAQDPVMATARLRAAVPNDARHMHRLE